MATTTPTGTLLVALDQIHVPANVRELDQAHVDALAGSIALQGMLVPVVLTPAESPGAFILVAGFHRVAAAHQLKLSEVPAVIRDTDLQAADRAVENITRLALDPYQEAVAVAAMLDRGLTEDGTAQALGWPRQRVAARMKLLELPERAQQMVGAGTIALSAVDQLRAIKDASPALLDAVIEYLAEGNEHVAERLSSQPGWVIDAALRTGRSGVFAAHLSRLDSYELAALKLGKKTEQLLEEATALHKQIDRYAYGAPPIRFSEQDVDQARAAGVLVEFGGSAPIITDRPTYRELCKQAIKRTIEELRERAAAVEQERKAAKAAGKTVVDPEAEARRERGRALRALAEQAHGANLDLGWALRNELASVEIDMNIARFFCFALLGADHDGSPYTSSGERVAELATRGIRLVVEEFRTDVTKVRKDGTRGAYRVDYGDPRKPEKPIAWLWKFLDSASSPSDLFGRALVVVAAEQYASRLVVPSSQQHTPMRWPSHKDHARKALAKLAGPHLPATLKALEKAVAKAHAENDGRRRAASVRPDAAESTEPVEAEHDVDRDGEDDGEVDGEVDGDLDEYELDQGDEEIHAAGAVGSDGGVDSDADPGL
ncbi:MAG: ParB/RepB/Spo0J family partition protein [Solirubrobacteraceae bacterium]